MPLMNGVEFLPAYAQRPANRHPAVIIMLTTCLSSGDMTLQSLPIAGDLTKPLTREKIRQIIAEHFPAN